MWILVLMLMGINDPSIPDGTKIAMARFNTQEACETAKQQVLERKGPPPGEGSTLECKQVQQGDK
jgi:hypothetical protein